MIFKDIFLNEIINKCYPESCENNLGNIKERYILKILFDSANKHISQKQLCRQLNTIKPIKGTNEKGIGTYINNVVTAITNSYLCPIKSDGTYDEITRKSQGRPKKGESPSELLHN